VATILYGVCFIRQVFFRVQLCRGPCQPVLGWYLMVILLNTHIVTYSVYCRLVRLPIPSLQAQPTKCSAWQQFFTACALSDKFFFVCNYGGRGPCQPVLGWYLIVTTGVCTIVCYLYFIFCWIYSQNISDVSYCTRFQRQ